MSLDPRVSLFSSMRTSFKQTLLLLDWTVSVVDRGRSRTPRGHPQLSPVGKDNQNHGAQLNSATSLTLSAYDIALDWTNRESRDFNRASCSWILNMRVPFRESDSRPTILLRVWEVRPSGSFHRRLWRCRHFRIRDV